MADNDWAAWFEEWTLSATQVTVRLLDELDPPKASEVWTVDLVAQEPADGFDYETMGMLVASLRTKVGFAPFEVSQKRAFTIWGGADYATQEIVLEVASWALKAPSIELTGGTAYDLLRMIFGRLVDAARQRGGALEPVVRDRAVELGRSHLTYHFDLPDGRDGPAQLEVRSEDLRGDGSRLFRYVQDEARYEVEFLDDACLGTIGRVGWVSTIATQAD